MYGYDGVKKRVWQLIDDDSLTEGEDVRAVAPAKVLQGKEAREWQRQSMD